MYIRKLFHFTTMLSIISAVHTNAQIPVKEWDFRFGGYEDDQLNVVVASADGGYLLAGISSSELSGDKTQPDWSNTYDYWVVKIDVAGLKQWDARYGGKKEDRLYAAITTSDGGYLLAGTSYSGNTGDKTEPLIGGTDFWIIKISSTGIPEWNKTYGGSSFDGLKDAIQTIDGGYLLGGYTRSEDGDVSQPGKGGDDYWLVKTDASGNKLWDKRFGTDGADQIIGIATSANGYLLAGRSSGGINGNRTVPSKGIIDYWLVKIDATGEKLWDVAFGSLGQDDLDVFKKSNDGGYILGGVTVDDIGGDKSTASFGGDDIWVLKIDSNAIKMWDTDLGGIDFDAAYSIYETADSGFLIGGESWSGVGGNKTAGNKGNIDFWAIKLNWGGSKIWDVSFGTADNEAIYSVLQTADKRFLLGGISNGGMDGDKSQDGWGGNDFWVLETTPDDISNNISTSGFFPSVKIFPNPSSSSASIQISLVADYVLKVELLDLMGQKIKTIAEGNFNAGTHQMNFSSENLPKGIYLLQLKMQSTAVIEKIIVQ